MVAVMVFRLNGFSRGYNDHLAHQGEEKIELFFAIIEDNHAYIKRYAHRRSH